MPIKIPQYESNTQPQGLLEVGGYPTANPPAYSGYLGQSIEKLGDAGTMWAATVARQQSEARVVDSLKGISDDQKLWTEKLNAAINGAPDNGAGVTNKILSDYEATRRSATFS